MDATLRNRHLLILDTETRALVGQCSGPTRDGRCPDLAAGQSLPCAGRRLVPAGGTGLEGWRLTILDAPIDTCPIAPLVL